MSLAEKISKQTEEYGINIGGNSGMFKFTKEGLYRIRIMTEPEVLATHFFGRGVPSHVCYGKEKGCKFHGADPQSQKGEEYKRPSIKLVCYIIDMNDRSSGIQLAELPLSLSYGITDLEKDPDFDFSTYPMPFDIKITYDPDNEDPKAKYRMNPAPQRTELTAEEMKALQENMTRMSPVEYIEKRKKKQMERDGMAVSKDTDETYNKVIEEAYSEEIKPEDIPW